MQVLFIVHVGETLGHLAHAITIARELEERGCTTECAAHGRAKQFWQAAGLQGKFFSVSWNWSHNACEPSAIRPDFGESLLESARQIREILKLRKPNYVVGMPGFASAQLARRHRIPHASVIHGTHLAPLIRLTDPQPEEESVLRITTRICHGALNDAFRLVARRLSVPMLTYEEFVATERIFVPQPGLPFEPTANMVVIDFITASLGETLQEPPSAVSDAVFITFGSGNPCDTSRLLELARRVFPRVIANTGHLRPPPDAEGITTRPFISSKDVAKRVTAVVSHGGIGTVGTFAEHGLPQLIIPTEIDQANMAVHARRAKLAASLGLKSFLERTTLGRRLPTFGDDEFVHALSRLRNVIAPRVRANGASAIAASICETQECMTS